MGGQRWILLNPDTGEILPPYDYVPDSFSYSPEALVPLLQVREAVTLLEEPESRNLRMHQFKAKRCGEKSVCKKPPAVLVIGASASALERLPTELLYMIVHELAEDDGVDCICLAICSKRLWSVARGVIEKYLHEVDIADSWAGDRLICVGDRMHPLDLPPEGFNTPEDLVRFSDDQYQYSFYYVAEDWPRASNCDYRHTFIEKRLGERGVMPYHEDSEIWASLKGPEFGGYYDKSDDIPTSDNPRLLRNLTTREYVHDSALLEWNKLLLEWDSAQKKPDDCVNRKIVPPVTLGHLCAVRICWSSEGVHLPYKDDIHRGVWAGHRFDIVPATELVQMNKDEKAWKDVSREVVDEMDNIWRYFLPDGWKSGPPAAQTGNETFINDVAVLVHSNFV